MLEKLKSAKDFVDAMVCQTKLKLALVKASKSFEETRNQMPEYMTYLETLEAYKQSKIDYGAAYDRFKQEIKSVDHV